MCSHKWRHTMIIPRNYKPDRSRPQRGFITCHCRYDDHTNTGLCWRLTSTPTAQRDLPCSLSFRHTGQVSLPATWMLSSLPRAVTCGHDGPNDASEPRLSPALFTRKASLFSSRSATVFAHYRARKTSDIDGEATVRVATCLVSSACFITAFLHKA